MPYNHKQENTTGLLTVLQWLSSSDILFQKFCFT